MPAAARLPWLAATALLLGLLAGGSAQQLDWEFQKWAAKRMHDQPMDPENNPKHKEAIEKGRTFACSVCNVLLAATLKRYHAAREGKLKGGFNEADNVKILHALCEHSAPKMADQMERARMLQNSGRAGGRGAALPREALRRCPSLAAPRACPAAAGA